MGRRLIKMACCYRLKKLANVAGLIQRSRLTKLAEGLVDPVDQRKFEAALGQDFNDMDRRDGITVERPLNIDYSQPPIPPVTSALDNAMADRNEIAHLGQSMDKVTSRDPSAVGTPVATNDMLRGDLPNAQDGYTASPSEEYIAPMDPAYARFTLPKTQSEYNRMMSAEAQNVYGKKWSELARSQREALRDQFYEQVGENYDNGNNAHAYVPKFMQNRYGFAPQYVGESQLTQPNLVATSGVPGPNTPPLPEPAPSEADSVSALGTTANPTMAKSAPKPAPAPQQAYQRTQPRQQNYVFNGPIAQGIRARNGGPVFNGPIAQGMRARFGRPRGMRPRFGRRWR